MIASADRPLRIGILGAAGIAPRSIIHPADRRDDVVIAAVASRNLDSAQAYAREHSIERAFGSYEELLADPTIDLVYVALPPSEHAFWSIMALEGGKDVLCEKPFGMNADQARRMRATADSTGRRLIEAFHDRYHPLSLELDAIKASGRLGDILSFDCEFSYIIPFDPLSLRHDPALGGGALMDLGCYPVHAARAFFGSEPTVVDATATLNPLGTDMSMEAHLRFESGATARVFSSMDITETFVSTLTIVGTKATLEVENLIFPSEGHSIRETANGVTRPLTVRGSETYDHQLEAIIRGLATGEQLLTEGDDSIANMVVMDAIYAKAGIARNFA
jgi:predicted dehydrogenase